MDANCFAEELIVPIFLVFLLEKVDKGRRKEKEKKKKGGGG